MSCQNRSFPKLAIGKTYRNKTQERWCGLPEVSLREEERVSLTGMSSSCVEGDQKSYPVTLTPRGWRRSQQDDANGHQAVEGMVRLQAERVAPE